MRLPSRTDRISMQLRAFAEARTGVAALEFALVMPVLILILACMFDLGMGFYRAMQVQHAAQRGAISATVNGFDAAKLTQAIIFGSSAISASPAPRLYCGCPTSTGVVEALCATPCAGYGTAGSYVAASARADYKPVFRYPSFPDVMSFTATEVVRIK